jgi:ATP-dependent 26S proteasome regulatory subunit
MHGHIVSASFEELANETVHDEAYPTLGEPVDQLVQRYLDANETVLVLLGPPGTGKTRLVRYLLGSLSRRKHASAEVMYTADRRALENDAIFVDFITGDHDAFVIEDADHLLQARTHGNHDMHRFLAIADGIVRAQGRKIIFTTNLPNIRDIDEALVRPGRCFKVIHTRALNDEEVERLIMRLCGEDTAACRRARERLPEGARGATVAEVYQACTAQARER